MDLMLRPYQQAAVDAVRAHWANGDKRVCLIAPTGAGKSIMCRALLQGARRPLAIVHTLTLRGQTQRTVPEAQVVTVQSLLPDGPRADSRRSLLATADRIFLDEAHIMAAEEFSTIAQLCPQADIVGATATPQRADGRPLGDIFAKMVVAAQYSELIRDAHLVPCDIAKPAMTRAQMKRLKVKPDPVKAYLAQGKRADGSWRPAILFAPTIALCTEHVEALRLAGVRSALVTCDTTGDERQAIFDRYTRGDLDLLASPAALAVGFDSPRAEVIVLGRLAQHLGIYLQMCGRVLRPFPGKARALLIDCSDAASVHGNPTDDRKYSLTGKGIEAVEPEEEDEEEEKTPIEMTRDELIEMEFTVLRQQLSDNINELRERATERGYRDAWVYHRIKERFGFELPRIMPSKYQSVCAHCRTRVAKEAPIYWRPPADGNAKSTVFHPDCYIQALPRDVLELVRGAS